MSTLTNWFRCLVNCQVFKRTRIHCICSHVRAFADSPEIRSKQVMVQGTESDERVRVRRARPSDVPRVLRFVREHAYTTWPGLAAPPSSPQLLLCDYVARALAQGHSMIAEQQEARRGWAHVRGIALSVAVCPWDASMLEKWARCVRCTHSRRLMAFTAHCLRAPALHDKYRVQNILQVILVVPQASKSTEIINLLAKNAIKRGRDIGFPLIRFDVTSDATAKILEDLHLKREWELSYDILPDAIKDPEAVILSTKPPISNSKETEFKKQTQPNERMKPSTYKHRVSVYSYAARTNLDN